MATSVSLPPDQARAICLRYDIAELAVFGSALREDFRAGVNLGPWLHRLSDLEAELSSLVGRQVDVVDRKGVEQSRNWIIRKSILESAEVIFGS